MPNVTVYNLTANPLTLPGGHYTSIVAPGSHATFSVPDLDEYVESASFAAMVASGYLRWEAAGGGMVYNYQQVLYGGTGTSVDATVKGVAATDCVFATLNASSNAVYVTKAVRTAADTVTITFSADPGANTTVALMVFRP
jgi:hypothetical protein